MTVKPEFTYEAVLNGMTKAVEERGTGFIYPNEERGLDNGTALSCRYVKHDQSAYSCIVGGALFHVGVPLSTLSEFDRDLNGSTDVLRAMEAKYGVQIPEKVFALCGEAQSVQDPGMRTWGDALESGKHSAETLIPGDYI